MLCPQNDGMAIVLLDPCATRWRMRLPEGGSVNGIYISVRTCGAQKSCGIIVLLFRNIGSCKKKKLIQTDFVPEQH